MYNAKIRRSSGKIKEVIKNASFTDPFVVKTPDKKLSPSELTRAIRLDISAELDAISLYEAHADATDNEKVKEVLLDIAKEEKVHVGELQELLRILLSDEQGFLDDGAKEVSGK